MLKVIGLGNELCGDDGIGPVVLNELNHRIRPMPVDLINAGSDAFIVLDYLLKSDPVLIIDCARMGRKPGEIMRFRTTQIQPPWINNSISLHGFSIGDVLKMASDLGRTADCVIIGIEPKILEFNSGLSEEVRQNIPAIVQMVMEEIKKYAKKSFDH
jgi:hydrogenase maturation protease